MWISTVENCTDMFTKNLQGPVFNKHARVFCGDDPKSFGVSPGEGVRVERNADHVSPTGTGHGTAESHTGTKSKKGNERMTVAGPSGVSHGTSNG